MRSGKIRDFIAGSMARGMGPAQDITSSATENFTAHALDGAIVSDLSS